MLLLLAPCRVGAEPSADSFSERAGCRWKLSLEWVCCVAWACGSCRGQSDNLSFFSCTHIRFFRHHHSFKHACWVCRCCVQRTQSCTALFHLNVHRRLLACACSSSTPSPSLQQSLKHKTIFVVFACNPSSVYFDTIVCGDTDSLRPRTCTLSQCNFALA